MPTLTERLQEVMTEKGWSYPDLVRHSGESRSVVSQWLGKATKTIKSIGKMEAAERLEKASGFAALWIAKGIGDKKITPAPPLPDELEAGQAYPDRTIPMIVEMLEKMSPRQQEQLLSVANLLSGPLGDRLAISFSVADPHAHAPSAAPASGQKRPA